MNPTASTESTITVFPSGKPLGAEIRGVDLRALTDADFAAIQRAWNDHSVLLFRGQQLTDDDLIAFSRRFGDLDWAPVQETGRRFVEGLSGDLRGLERDREWRADRQSGRGRGDAGTPTCRTWKIRRRRACCMRWRFLPTGGNTYFCGMYHAYDSLPDALKHRIAGTDVEARWHLQQRRISAPGRHGRRRSGDVAGRVSSAGLHASGNQAPRALSGTTGGMPTFRVCRWRNPKRCSMSCGRSPRAKNSRGTTSGGWAIWCCGTIARTMHRRDPFDPDSRRIMHRTQIKSETRPAA